MTKWTIYSKNGNPRCECVTGFTEDKARPVGQDTLEYSGKWMGECFLTVSIKSPYPIDFQIGDYIDYRGERFTINYDPTVIKKARRGTYGEGFTYDSIKFNSRSVELSEIRFHDWVLNDNKYHYTSLPNFSFYCKDVDDLVDRLQANANRYCKDNGFAKEDYWMFYTLRNNTSGTVDEGQSQTTYERTVQRAQSISTDAAFVANVKAQWEKIYGTGDNYKDSRDDERYDRNITASSQSVWDMMTAIKQQFGLNFIIRGRNVYVGTAGVPTSHLFEYGKNKGLYEVDKTAETDQQVVTKLHAYGSDENLPTRYYADLGKQVGCLVKKIVSKGTTDNPSIAFSTNLPFGNKYFYEVVEGYENSDDKRFYVSMKCSSSAVRGVVYKDGDGNTLFQADKSTETNTTALAALMQEVATDAIVYFMKGMRANTFSSSYTYYIPSNLPDNMAVNNLMLPGFPNNSLADLCKAEYDSKTNITTYYIRKDKNSQYIAFHTESGNHVVKFSDDKYNPYILSPNASELGIMEGDIFCNEENDDNGLKKVYPTIEEVTDVDAGTGSTGSRLDAVVKADKVDDNGVYPNDKTDEVKGFNIYIPDLGFDLKQAAEDAGGSDMKISMKNGFCGGRTFDVANVTKQNDGTWKLDCKRVLDNDLDIYFPYSYAASVKEVSEDMTDAYQVMPGDNYVLTGIAVNDVNYVWAASVKLLRKAIHWLCKNDYTRYVYTPKIDEIYMARQDKEAKASGQVSLHDTLKEGDMLLFADDDLRLNGAVYIDQLNIRENGNNGIPTYDVTLRDEIQVGTIQRIQNQVDSIKTDIANGNVGGGGVSPTQIDPLVKSYGEKYFLSKVHRDTAHEHIDFEKGATVQEMLKSDNAQSENYIHTGFPFGKGWGAMRNDGNGASMLEVDKLYVRMKAIFAELEIRKISYVGGNYLFSAAGSKVYYVEWLDANGNILEKTEDNKSLVNTYRCYMYTDDGTTSTLNYFKAGDQVRCQTFDVERDSDNAIKNGDGFITATAASSRYWWRKVNAIGQGKIAAKSDDTEYQYVDFLNIAGDYAVGSDIPEVGDAMVQFGSWTDAERDGAILIVVVGDMSPAIVQYMGICDAANGGSKHFVAPEAYTRICANPKYGNIIRGKFISIADSSSDPGRNDGESVDDIINRLIDRINDIQNQADKKFELWFNSGAPHPNSATDTEANAPASNWLTESEKALHAQDLYYDTDKAPASQGGRAWRYTAHDITDDDTPSIAYYWDEVTDQDTINALEKAADLQAQNSLAALAEKVYDISGGYIKSNDSGYIKVSLETDAVDGEGNILYKDSALSRCVKDTSDGKLKWETIDNDSYKDTFLGAYQAVGSRTITVYKSKPTDGANNYDLILRWVDWYDTFKEENIADGNLEILMYSNGAWRMLRECTHAVVENLGNELRSVVYGTDENGMFASGIRSLKNMNTMFSQYENEGGLVTKAQISTRIKFDEKTDKAIGLVNVEAEEINFVGNVLVNDKFWIDEDGNAHMNNATVDGDFVSGDDGFSKVIIKKDENGNASMEFKRNGVDYIRLGYNDGLEIQNLPEQFKDVVTKGAYLIMGNWHGSQTDFGFFSRSWSQTMVMTTEATHADVFYHSSPVTIDLGGRYTLPGLSAAFNGGIKVGTIICDASSEIIINLGSPSDTENKYRWLWIIHKSSAHVTFESDGDNMYMGSSKRGVSQWIVETLGLIGLIYSDGTCWHGNYMNGQ